MAAQDHFYSFPHDLRYVWSKFIDCVRTPLWLTFDIFFHWVQCMYEVCVMVLMVTTRASFSYV